MDALLGAGERDLVPVIARAGSFGMWALKRSGELFGTRQMPVGRAVCRHEQENKPVNRNRPRCLPSLAFVARLLECWN